ncbi:MAG TPA: GIY-YIG nuclease family protein [Verrucomicrobiae bacterium]|nr:GIY-YIG nuclease family protein [Verrucomicrobiae bacterium]
MSENEQEDQTNGPPRGTDLLGQTIEDTTGDSAKPRAKSGRVARAPRGRSESVKGDTAADRELFDREISWAAWVYVIGAEEGLRKVGYSTHPFKRLVSLKRDAPPGAKVLHATLLDYHEARQVEFRAHAILGPTRVRGEWFDVTDDVAISAVIQATNDLGFWGKHMAPEELDAAKAVPCQLSARQYQVLADLARQDDRPIATYLSRLVAARLDEIEDERRRRRLKP